MNGLGNKALRCRIENSVYTLTDIVSRDNVRPTLYVAAAPPTQ